MKSNRRNFLKLSGLTGVGLAGGDVAAAFAAEAENKPRWF
ncbi:MAG: twin-arginine translocation signal domain-containing protein [Segetibacter sp.]